MMTKLYNQKSQTELRRRLRKTMPKGEIILWSRLKNSKLGHKFRRQYGVGKYVIDFYCRELRLAIEVDGLTHDFDDRVIYDRERQKYIESKSIRIKRFSSQEIFEDIDNVVNQIYFICQDMEIGEK